MRRDEKRTGLPVDHEDVILQIAALAYRDRINQQLDDISGDPNVPGLPLETAAEIHDSVMHDFAQFRRRKARKKRRRQILRITACVILLCIMLPIGIYQIDATRVATVNYLIKTFPKYSEIHYDVQNNALPPIGWKQPYYPTWLPEGTKVTRIESGDQGDYIWYQDANGHEFRFVAITATEHLSAYDDEDIVSREVIINGYTAVLSYSEKKNTRTLVIPVENCFLILRGALSETDICKIGEKINLA